MFSATSSSMGLFRFGFRLLLIVCCFLIVTSYRIDHRPFEDRNERAVTEWRFRRNFLFPIPYFYPSSSNEHLANNNEVENENDSKIYHTKYLPNLTYD
ncbi:hypothetical protein I4U23_014749 [Adineta vaga]|nr:hypothetical protein I4U23_014749 [Adineta vaga]